VKIKRVQEKKTRNNYFKRKNKNGKFFYFFLNNGLGIDTLAPAGRKKTRRKATFMAQRPNALHMDRSKLSPLSERISYSYGSE
jgi:hypothetical protein